jgi:hypothetical protein
MWVQLSWCWMLSVAFVQNTCSLFSVINHTHNWLMCTVVLSFSLYHHRLQYGSNEEYDVDMKCGFLGLYFNFCCQRMVSYGQNCDSCCVIWAIILFLRAGIIQRLRGFNIQQHWAAFSKANMGDVVWKTINPIKMLQEVQNWCNLFIPCWHRLCFITIICFLKEFLVHCCLLFMAWFWVPQL